MAGASTAQRTALSENKTIGSVPPSGGGIYTPMPMVNSVPEPTSGFNQTQYSPATTQMPQYNQPAQQAGQQPNIFNAVAQGMEQAGMTAGMETMYRPATIAGTDLTQYTNPYETQVVNQSLQDLDRARQMQANQLGAQATTAGAFGGSRQALMESELGRNYMDQAARTASGLRQAGFQNAQQMAGQDITTGLQGSQNRLNAANQLGSIANLGFGMGMDLNAQAAQQGALEQGINQLILDAAKNQFAGYAGAPAQSLGYMSQALGATPTPTTTTQTKEPGLFDYLTLGAQTYGAVKSDINLKDDIVKVGQLNDKVGLYKWKWNSIAKKLGVNTPEYGVLAQEVEKVLPSAVSTADDGFKQVRYDMVYKAFA